MIRLNLGREPAELRAKRNSRLPKAIIAFNTHGHGSSELSEVLKDGYQVVKETLRLRQHGKCAFCERGEDAFNQPVEHFRPKGGASDFDGANWSPSVSSHYWWLAWTWSNLLFACDDCNRVGAKGNRFPIAAGTVRIAAPVTPLRKIGRSHTAVKRETAMLINPREEDPFKHLQWMPVDRSAHRWNWTWTIVGRDARGSLTIDTLDLTYRTDEVNLHLQRMRPCWKAIDRAIAANRISEARETWNDLVQDFLANKDQPFRNAVWWSLDSLYPLAERRKFGFTGFDKPRG